MKRLVVWFALILMLVGCAAVVADSGTGYSNVLTIDNRYGGTGGSGGSQGTSTAKRSVVLLVRGLRPPGGTTDSDTYWNDALYWLSLKLGAWADVETVSAVNIFDGGGTADTAGAKLRDLVVQKHADGKDVYIVAHSMGGLVTRSCLSKLKHDGLRSYVKDVVMLSTPNCGSHAADVVVSAGRIAATGGTGNPAIAKLYGMLVNSNHMGQAVWDCQTDVVLGHSRSWSDAGERYWLLGGTGPLTSVLYSVASPVLKYWPVPTVNDNDGVVTKMSAWGQYWSGGLISRQMANTLPGARMSAYSCDHTWIAHSFSVLNDVAAIISRTYAQSGGQQSAQTQHITNVAPSEASGGAAVILDLRSGTISNGQTNEIDIPVDQLSEVVFAVNYESGGPIFTLVQPDSVVLTPTAPGTAVYQTSSDNGLAKPLILYQHLSLVTGSSESLERRQTTGLHILWRRMQQES